MAVIRLVDAGSELGARAMARDDVLVHRLRAGGLAGPVVRVHGWMKPVVTLGRAQELDAELARAARAAGIPVVRRPTGGGWLLHLPGDLSITLADAGPLGPGAFRATARRVARAIAEGLTALGARAELFTGLARDASRAEVCFERADRDEVVLGETKAAGVALARCGRAVLVQTAIPAAKAPAALEEFAARFDPRRADAADALAGVDVGRLGRAIAASLAGPGAGQIEAWSWPEAWEAEAAEREALRFRDLAVFPSESRRGARA